MSWLARIRGVPLNLVIALIAGGVTFACAQQALPSRGGALPGGAPAALEVPGPVQGLTVVAGPGRLQVSWTAAGGGDVAPTTARLRGRPGLDRGPRRTCTTTGTRCLFDELTDGVSYDVVAFRQNGAGVSQLRSVTAIPYPAVLASASTVLWLDAADPATLIAADGTTAGVGQPISGWRDRSPAGRYATSRGPAPTVETVAAHTGVRLAPGAALTASAAGLPVGAAASTVYVVAATSNPSTDACSTLIAWGTPQPGAARTVQKGCAAAPALASTLGAAAKARPTRPWPASLSLLSATYTADGVEVLLNRRVSSTWRAVTPVDRMHTGVSSTLGIGATPWAGGAGWDGRIAEIIVLTGRATAADTAAVTVYLARKWKIAPGPAGLPHPLGSHHA